MVVSLVTFGLMMFTLIGGPMVLSDWRRKRRETVIARQIALTDALDGRFGPIVAPVVMKPLFGPWEVRIAMPFLRSGVLARMLSVIDDVFADGEPMPSNPYRIIFTVAQNAHRSGAARGVHEPAERWAQTSVGAA